MKSLTFFLFFFLSFPRTHAPRKKKPSLSSESFSDQRVLDRGGEIIENENRQPERLPCFFPSPSPSLSKIPFRDKKRKPSITFFSSPFLYRNFLHPPSAPLPRSVRGAEERRGEENVAKFVESISHSPPIWTL